MAWRIFAFLMARELSRGDMAAWKVVVIMRGEVLSARDRGRDAQMRHRAIIREISCFIERECHFLFRVFGIKSTTIPMRLQEPIWKTREAFSNHMQA